MSSEGWIRIQSYLRGVPGSCEKKSRILTTVVNLLSKLYPLNQQVLHLLLRMPGLINPFARPEPRIYACP